MKSQAAVQPAERASQARGAQAESHANGQRPWASADSSPQVRQLLARGNLLNSSPQVIQLKVLALALREPVSPVLNLGARAPVQRVVRSIVEPMMDGTSSISYYSSYDTATKFVTAALAQAHDDLLAAEHGIGFDRHARVPTNFTYHQTGSRNVVGSTGRQGPHSLSHCTLAHRLNLRFESGDFDLRATFEEQVISKAEFARLFRLEAPTTVKPNQILRAITDYGLHYDRLFAMLGQDDFDADVAYELMMSLIQMHPYSAYGKKPQGKKRMQKKDEAREKPFSQSFDRMAKFRDAAEYAKFGERRRALYPEEQQKSAAEGGGGEEKEREEEEEEGSRVRKKVKAESSSSSSGNASVRPVVHLDRIEEVKNRGWNAGDEFEAADQPGIRFVWRVNHMEGMGISRGDFVVKLRGG